MSIHAQVFCSCYQRGVWPLLPFPPDAVAITGTGEVVLVGDAEKYTHRFQAWKADAQRVCGHSYQLRLHVLVAYYPLWGKFVRAVRGGRFSVLSFLIDQAENPHETAENPEGAVFPLSLTADLLQELRNFRAQREVDWYPGVVDGQTRQPLEISDLDAPPWRVWLERNGEGKGQVVISNEKSQIFASHQFQLLKHPDSGYIYRNNGLSETETRDVFCPYSIIKSGNSGSVEIIRVPLHGSDYSDILGPLENLCLAALEEDHPIVWT